MNLPILKIRFFFNSVLLCTLFALGIGCANTPHSKKSLSQTERARLIVEAANGALVEGDPTGALQHLAKAEEEDPELPELYHSKALAYFAKKDSQTALKAVKKALELKPEYTDANNTMGKLLMDGGYYGEAEKYFLKAAKDPLYREAYKVHTHLGILYYRRGEDSKSLIHLNKAVEEAPLQACIAYYYKGHVSLRSGKFQEALKEYDRATQKFCAQFAEGHLALGMLYERNKEYDRARKKFLDIKQRFPDTKVAEQAMDRLKFLP